MRVVVVMQMVVVVEMLVVPCRDSTSCWAQIKPFWAMLDLPLALFATF